MVMSIANKHCEEKLQGTLKRERGQKDVNG